MLADITPVLLTYNEGINIERTLDRLRWARDIVVVDSGSTDTTVELARKFPQVRLFTRSFDTHGNQWRYAVLETGIATPWLLRLDADYQVSDELVAEMASLPPEADVNAYRIGFDYAVFSRRLRSSMYPANTVLLRRGHFTVWDRGHTEAWTVDGKIGHLKAKIVHDDWKPMAHWTGAQARYMRRELARLTSAPSGFRDWLRLHPPLMPIVVFFYCLLVKRLILDGEAGLFYTLQRTTAETILALLLIESRLQSRFTGAVPEAASDISSYDAS